MSTKHSLIPIDSFQHGFTTCPDLKLKNVSQFLLEDKQLAVHKITSRLPHNVVCPPPPVSSNNCDDELPPPSLAWEAIYPKGSINPSAPIPGGFGFYLSGPPRFAQALQGGAMEAVMSYRMMLDQDWDFVKGGKLPGAFGGTGKLAYGCTGGRQENRRNCFSLRLMWRAQGQGELYAYLPMTANNKKQLLAVPPRSTENADYGISVGRGAFNITPGTWTSVALRVKLNDLGIENGEIQLWVDGKSVICVNGLTLRDCEECRIAGMHFQTFFGGHGDEWAASRDQKAWFADVTGVVVV